MKILKRNSGFTLIEILLAITLLSLMMLGVYQIVDDSILTKDRVIAEDREFLQVETAFHRFELDFNQIYSPLYFSSLKNPDKTKRKKIDNDNDENAFQASTRFPKITYKGHLVPVIENPDKSTLAFMTTSNRRKVQNSKQANYAWVQYTLRTSESDDVNQDAQYELIRYYNPENPYLGDHNWDDVKPSILLKNVQSMEINFWDKKKEAYVSSLNELGNKSILRGIQVIIDWVDSNNNKQTFERTFRPSWVYFNPKVDEQAIKASAPKGPGSNEEDESFEIFD